MKKYLSLLIILFSVGNLFCQHHEEHLNISATGDQVVPLGLYSIGSAIRIECQIDGGWAEDGGIYHIASDWGSLPKVIYRGESSISNRLRFYGYLPNNTNSKAYLFIKWENKSPGKSYSNTVHLSIYCEKAFDKDNYGDFSSASELEDVLIVQSNSSNVGIGTTNPSAKLHVSGTIRANEIRVEAGNNTADFVFEENYPLRNLDQVKAFIKENKHLPDIPSAAEMETLGVNLAEMNKLLLQKIEELTLYVIEQENKLGEKDRIVYDLKLEVKELKRINLTIIDRLDVVEKRLMSE